VTRVLIADDEELVRAGLRMILESADELIVVDEVGDGAEAVRSVRRTTPHVVLIDIHMPNTDGITATATLASLPNPPAVIVLTTFDADDYVFRALQAGAIGFLLKDTPPQQLIQAVRLAATGDSMLSPRIARQLISHIADDTRLDQRQQALARLNGLTAREREVLAQVGLGATNSEIAETLHMSQATVKSHITHLFEKLSVSNRVQAAILAHHANIID
jgi:DNA-binding NarL/FixJ family response regulator